MDSVNTTLLLSLKQEVKTLNGIVKNLQALSDDGEEIRSWLFPSKPHYFVNELLNSDSIFETESFKTYLELIIDRLYVGIRMILNYVEKTDRKEKEHRFIHRPKLITLGFTFERLWQTVSDILSRNMSTSLNKESRTGKDNTGKLLNKEIQTNIISLNKCDSCSSAILCMKNLLLSFDKKEFKNPFNDKQLLRPKMYDITQFGCMLQTTSAVEKGINSLYEKLFLKEQEIKLLQNENNPLKAEMTKKCERITFLEREVTILKEKCERDDLKITLLSNKNEELVQVKDGQDCQIKTLNEVVSNLNMSIKSYRENVVRLASEKEHLYFFCKGVVKKQLNVIKFGTLLKDRLSVIEDEHLFMKNSCEVLQQITENINNKLNRTTNALTAVDLKMYEISKQDHNAVLLKSKLQEFKKAYLMKRSQEETDKDLTKLQKQGSFQVKGNPVEDLTLQMEENNKAIKKLENDNIKLKSIISKLTCLKK